MESKEFNEILNKSRTELNDLLSDIKSKEPDNPIVCYLIETIQQLIDLGEQSYCHLRDRLIEFNG